VGLRGVTFKARLRCTLHTRQYARHNPHAHAQQRTVCPAACWAARALVHQTRQGSVRVARAQCTGMPRCRVLPPLRREAALSDALANAARRRTSAAPRAVRCWRRETNRGARRRERHVGMALWVASRGSSPAALAALSSACTSGTRTAVLDGALRLIRGPRTRSSARACASSAVAAAAAHCAPLASDGGRRVHAGAAGWTLSCTTRRAAGVRARGGGPDALGEAHAALNGAKLEAQWASYERAPSAPSTVRLAACSNPRLATRSTPPAVCEPARL
jgi:hypothetical protein